MNAIDIVILSNGPGEVTTWVKPVVRSLRSLPSSDRMRISVVLSPCPHALGNEAAIARQYPEVDRVQSAEHFLRFLLFGKTAENWNWRRKGIVLFLGGDQFFPLVIGKRLGYKTIIYAEWDARWYRWIDAFALRNPKIFQQIPPKYHSKCTVVGDLMLDVSASQLHSPEQQELIGLLPGSKPAKLAQGVPLGLAIAQAIHSQRPQTQFIIPVAPTLDLRTLAKFANPKTNPVIAKVGNVSGDIIEINGKLYIETSGGLKIELYTDFPAYEILSQCRLCLTTVGANTAQLGALGIPMIVLLPTQQLDAMRAWDGLPGILANLPGVGSIFAKLINRIVLKQGRLFAWPNIWAGREIIPELVGELQPKEVAELALNWLENPEKLREIREQLRQIRGEAGAADKLAQMINQQLDD